MSNKKSAADKLAAKKNIVKGNKSSKTVPVILLALGALVAVSGVYFFMGGSTGPTTATAQATQGPAAVSGELRYPVAAFADGQAKYYEHRGADGILVKYFVVQANDGTIRAAFDACDSCWRSGKGYSQEGDEMVCGNCRMRFPTDKVNEVKGGCNPSPLERTIDGSEVVIRVSDIDKGSCYFDFKKRKADG